MRSLEALRDRIVENVARHGQHVTGVTGEEPFYYTTGNYSLGLPELLVACPLHPVVATAILNELGAYQRGARRPFRHLSQHLMQDARTPVTLLDVVRGSPGYERVHREFVCISDVIYGVDVPVTQVVVPDCSGRLPWQPGCEGPFARQPVLGRVLAGVPDDVN